MNKACSSKCSPKATARGRIVWPQQPSVKQRFSLPGSIMYYIAKKTTTPDACMKKFKICKFFYECNPVIVVPILNEKCIVTKTDECDLKEQVLHHLNDSRFTSVCKYWVTDMVAFCSDHQNPHAPAILRKKLYQCDASHVDLYRKSVKVDLFKMLAGSAKHVALLFSRVVQKGGRMAKLETILGALPQVERFTLYYEYYSFMIDDETFENLNRLENLGNLKSFRIEWMSPVCNLDDLFDFMSKHQATVFYIRFNNRCVFTEEEKLALGALVDAVIESSMPNRLIIYDDQDFEKLQIMYDRCDDEYVY